MADKENEAKKPKAPKGDAKGAPKGEAKAFIDFILSPEGQKIVQDVGYVPIKPASGD